MRLVYVALLTLTSFGAMAETVSCNTCGSGNSYRDAAKNAINTSWTDSPPIYVINQSAGVVKKFNTVPRLRIATEVDVETAVYDYFNFVMSQNGISIQIPSGIQPAAAGRMQAASSNGFPDTGYELVEYPQLSEGVGAYLKTSGWGQINDFMRFLSAVNPFKGFNPSAASMTLRAVLSDGSTALFFYNSDTQTFERLKGQTRDSSGNIVAETKEDLISPGTTRTYSFPNNDTGMRDYVSFVQRAQSLGVPISGGTGYGTVTIDCSGAKCQVHVKQSTE